MLIRTDKKGLAIAFICMGVLVLLIPKGWDEAPLLKLGGAAFIIGMGVLGLKYR